MEPIIELNQLTKKYANGVTVLENVSYTFQQGKFYGIIGPSGSGKTTLLQLIGTLDTATSGDISILNRPVSQMSYKEKAQFRNQHVGFVFQSYFLNDKLTAVENVMLPMLITEQTLVQCQQKAEILLTQVGLKNRLSHLPAQLSGGEQQRVAIARALANTPDIILADEPTGNLDEESEQAIMQLFCDFMQKTNKTVIMVTHNKAILTNVDHILKLHNGTLYSI